jgi:histidine triad (HIT) family protein
MPSTRFNDQGRRSPRASFLLSVNLFAMVSKLEVPQRDPCPFCENIALGQTSSGTPCAVVEELDATFAFVLPRQIAPPHIVVITKRHAATLLDLTADEASAVAQHVRRIADAVHREFSPLGFSVFQNNGVAAGQSVGHYHMHLAPAYPGQQPYILARDQPVTPFEERLALAERVWNAMR